ncbi:MAG: deoxyribose-phosphate aldolase [Clostridia bacterium]|nr:deoxyribose-phosphate aldolase [Clostridia bacterium]
MDNQTLAKYIDHTLLKADATEEAILRVCEEAKHYGTASVCVNTARIPLAAKALEGSGVKACCVVGFPLGAMLPAAKAAEAAFAIEAGADEVDMVINIGKAKDGDWDYVQKDIEAVEAVCKGKALLKVIIETCLLTDDEKVKACLAAKAAGADFVKTSTGFSTGGATVADIALMRKTVGPDMGVKASGGVRTREAAEAMIAAGATRIGASSSKGILGE